MLTSPRGTVRRPGWQSPRHHATLAPKGADFNVSRASSLRKREPDAERDEHSAERPVEPGHRALPGARGGGRGPTTDHATSRFHSNPLQLKIAPSSTNASALCGASAAMNCGRKARKKSATFGFSTLVSNALREDPLHRCRGRARDTRELAMRPTSQIASPAEIDEIRAADPVHDRESRGGRGQDRREAEGCGQRMHDDPGAIPNAATAPARKPCAVPRPTM